MTKNKHRCFGIVFDDIDKDSRVKRAGRVISERFSTYIYATTAQGSESYPFKTSAPNYAFNSLTLRTFEFFIKAVYAGVKTKPKLIYCGGLGPLIVGVFIKACTRAKLIYDARELYLKNERGESTYSDKHRLCEKIFSPYADYIITANEQRAKCMQDFYQLPVRPTPIQNIPDDSFKATSDALKDEFAYLTQPENRVLIYQGHLGGTRGLEKFVYSLQYLEDNVHLSVVAIGAGVDVVKDIVEELAIGNRVHFHSLQTPEVLASILTKANLGIISYDLWGPNNEYCAPNKLYEYSQMGLLCITSPQTTFVELFAQHPVGMAIDRDDWHNNNYRNIANVIERLLVIEQKYKEKKKSLEAFNAKYNWENERLKFINLLDSIKLNELSPRG